tara:strand:+ start:206 stop:979 length:774 start_codon:yes stop_codon:yes gene_type:complete
MKFAIPSYKRPTELKEQTLTYLNTHKIETKDIFIFVRNDDEKLPEYLELKEQGYNVIIAYGVFGIGKTHNFITAFFDEDEFICEIDDDLKFIMNEKREPITDLSKEIDDMVLIMIENNINYGGTYQCSNPGWMSANKKYTFDLRYMLGLFRIRRIKKDIFLETNYAEDMENCIKYYIRDGQILKNNWLVGKTKNYANGGCNGDGRNFETEKKDKVFLAEKYPDYCKLFQRKNGRWDLRLYVPKSKRHEQYQPAEPPQ